MKAIRFDIVVFNYQRIELFFKNFSKIKGICPDKDRITVVSCSPSANEMRSVREFSEEQQLPVRYLTRENKGIDQLARAEYFLGVCGGKEENLQSEFIFQFQDHYLDTDAECSRWGKEFDFRIKGDVVPDGIVFDLNKIYTTLKTENLSGAFCDRNNPCWFKHRNNVFVAPCGGNFIVSTSSLVSERSQRLIRQLARSCDNTYTWAVFAEFYWGEILFPEGARYYDIKRQRVFNNWPRDDFYVAPDDYRSLRRYYISPLAPILQLWRMLRALARRTLVRLRLWK